MTPIDERELSDLEHQVEHLELQATAWSAGTNVSAIFNERLNSEVAPHLTRFVTLLDQVTEALRLGVDRIDDGVRAVEDAKEQCVSNLDKTEEAVKGHLDDLSTALAFEADRIVTIREEFSNDCADVLDNFVTSDVVDVTSEIDDTVEALAKTLTEKAEEVLLAAVENADREVRRQLQEVATPVIEVVEEAIDEVFAKALAAMLDGSEESSSKREAMEMMLEQLEPAFEALQTSMEHVRGVARSVGVSL